MFESRPDVRDYFDTMVVPAYHDFRERPSSQPRAKAVIIYLNDLAERVYHRLDLSQQFPGRLGPGNFRNSLAAECEEIGLVRDIADGQKHYQLDRINRRVTSAEQSRLVSLILDEVPDFDEIERFDDIKMIVVELDDGNRRVLKDIIEVALNFWVRKLETYEL